MKNLNNLDIYLFKIINASGFQDIDIFMILISSKWVWIPLYIFLLFKLYKKFHDQFICIVISIFLLIFISDFGSVHLFKEVFERIRPCHQLENIRVVNGCGGLYSFISSHAANSFAIAFFISMIFKRFWIFCILFSWATLIGYSRVYLGVHFPFDILGGMFWGLTSSILTYLILKKYLIKN